MDRFQEKHFKSLERQLQRSEEALMQSQNAIKEELEELREKSDNQVQSLDSIEQKLKGIEKGQNAIKEEVKELKMRSDQRYQLILDSYEMVSHCQSAMKEELKAIGVTLNEQNRHLQTQEKDSDRTTESLLKEMRELRERQTRLELSLEKSSKTIKGRKDETKPPRGLTSSKEKPSKEVNGPENVLQNPWYFTIEDVKQKLDGWSLRKQRDFYSPEVFTDSTKAHKVQIHIHFGPNRGIHMRVCITCVHSDSDGVCSYARNGLCCSGHVVNKTREQAHTSYWAIYRAKIPAGGKCQWFQTEEPNGPVVLRDLAQEYLSDDALHFKWTFSVKREVLCI